MSQAAPLTVSAVPEEADPTVASPLSRFQGERPPTPAWFDDAIAHAPERRFVEVQGVPIELLIWGERGKPGLLFLHGNGAHADWWSFIAPFFAATHRVAAISWSGMGKSGWRDRYDYPTFLREAVAGAEAAGLFEGGAKPTVVAHSFGGGVATYMAAVEGERFAATVIVDAGVRPPELRWRGPPSRGPRPTRVYETLRDGLARFRLAPPQPCENLFLLDFIGRESLRPAPLPDRPDENGWSWRFDPHIWDKMTRVDRAEQEAELAAARCPLAFIWGARSRLMGLATVDYTRLHAPPGTPMLAVPEAEHHVWLDQPLAFVSTLRGLLSAWPAPGETVFATGGRTTPRED